MKTLFKFIIGIPVICSFLIALIFMLAGVYEGVQGTVGILKGQIGTESTPGVKLFNSLDLFLLGFLFLIFSIGFFQLFFPRPTKFVAIVDTITPDWLKVENFTQLKLILWDTALTTLVVLFVGEAFKAYGTYTWELIIIPIAIVLIALSKFLVIKR